MKPLKFVIMASAFFVAVHARASLFDVYDLTFTQTGGPMVGGVTMATGQIDVNNSGIAVGGSLNVFSGPNMGLYALVPGTGNDGIFVYDNVVFPSLVSGGFLDGTAGLLWSSTGLPGAPAEMNMWYNPTAQPFIDQTEPSGSYSLWGVPPEYNPEADGFASLTLVATAVPEPTTVISGALLLLPFGASMLRILRKRQVA